MYSPSTDLSGLDPKAMYRVVSPKRSIFPALKTSEPCTSWPFPDSAVFTLLRPLWNHDPRISAMFSASLPRIARMSGIPNFLASRSSASTSAAERSSHLSR